MQPADRAVDLEGGSTSCAGHTISEAVLELGEGVAPPELHKYPSLQAALESAVERHRAGLFTPPPPGLKIGGNRSGIGVEVRLTHTKLHIP